MVSLSLASGPFSLTSSKTGLILTTLALSLLGIGTTSTKVAMVVRLVNTGELIKLTCMCEGRDCWELRVRENWGKALLRELPGFHISRTAESQEIAPGAQSLVRSLQQTSAGLVVHAGWGVLS